MNDTQKPNYKAFIPVGITFLGTGVVFIAAVNPAIGLGLIGVGIAFIAVGIKNKKKE
jgi:hypothetical protein